jgi:riboflavin biosynthesis pyrimidine reductase
VKLTRVFPASPEQWETEAPGFRARLCAQYRPPTREWVRVNMVASLNGSVVGAAVTSSSLSSVLDRTVMGVIRESADLVLVGASSVRAEGYRPSSHAPTAIVTSRSDVRNGIHAPILVVPESRRVQYRWRENESRVTIIGVPDTDGEMEGGSIIAELREAGFHTILCEGGPRLVSTLLVADTVDELCLTTSPRIVTPAIPLLAGVDPQDAGFVLGHLLVDEESYVYARWMRHGG